MTKIWLSFILALFVFQLSAGAQSCTFTLFKIPNFDTLPNRIDRSGKVVGEASNSYGTVIGFIRSASGGITQYTAPNSSATAIADRNSTGEMVGSYQDTAQHWHGFILQNKTFTVVDYPGGANTNLNGINDTGTIVGTYQNSSNNYVGFELTNGVFTTIMYPGAAWTQPEGINNFGQITGQYGLSGGLNQGFVLAGGKYITLNDPSGKAGTSLGGSNSHGEIAGSADISLTVPTQGFVYHKGQFTTIVVPNASFDTAGGINTYGVITGAASFSDGYHGYIAQCH